MLKASSLQCVRGGRTLFSDLDFRLAPGSLLELRGANGSGKTSLLRMLCGLLAPSAGDITWGGADIGAVREEYCAQIAYVGHLNGVKDELTALENVLLAARASGLNVDADGADAALATLGLNGFAHAPCRTLSQGQRRRVALARLCLSAQRPLWILDEPYAALDTAATRVMHALLTAHLERGGMAALSVHQDVEIAASAVWRIELSS